MFGKGSAVFAFLFFVLLVVPAVFGSTNPNGISRDEMLRIGRRSRYLRETVNSNPDPEARIAAIAQLQKLITPKDYETVQRQTFPFFIGAALSHPAAEERFAALGYIDFVFHNVSTPNAKLDMARRLLPFLVDCLEGEPSARVRARAMAIVVRILLFAPLEKLNTLGFQGRLVKQVRRGTLDTDDISLQRLSDLLWRRYCERTALGS